MQLLEHPLAPILDASAEVLILGSFPSVKSRESGFYYGHPQNRFWRVLAAITDSRVPQSVEEKTALLLRNHLALWDCIGSCRIVGSQDSAIRDVTPNPIAALLAETSITRVFCNGSAAYTCFQRYIAADVNLRAERLPSTSPANAAWTLSRLIPAWRVILPQNSIPQLPQKSDIRNAEDSRQNQA